MTVTECFSPPPLPVTEMGYVPGLARPSTFIVMVELPAPGAGIVGGLKLTVAPGGTLLADKLIELLNPPLIVVVMVDVL